MEVRRLCNNKEFYFQVTGIETCMPYFKDVKPLGSSSAVCCGSPNGKDWKDNLIIGPAFLSINNPFSILTDNRIVTQNDQGLWCVLDYFGKTIVPYGVYSKIDGYKSRLARVKKVNTAVFWEDNKEEYYNTFGIIDMDGKEIVGCNYDEIYKFYGTDNAFTILKRGAEKTNFHLGYRKEFSFNDIERMQFLEDRGSLYRWDKDYGQDNFKYISNRANYIHDSIDDLEENEDD